MSQRSRSGPAASRVGVMSDSRQLPPSARPRGDAQPENAAGRSEQAGVSTVATSRRRAARVTLAIALAGSMLAGVVLAFHGHVNLLRDAFGASSGSAAGQNGQAADTSNLYTEVNNLSTDAIYVLGPCVTLAGAVGGILWALGGRRGPSIVAGAVAAGVVGAGLKTIVS